MKFSTEVLKYAEDSKNTVLDYDVTITPLKEEDSTYVWLDIGNYSLTGFEINMHRNYMKYVVNYFLPSGLFVVVSWVRKKFSKSSFLIYIALVNANANA